MPDARPDLPRLPAARDGLERLQRPAGRGAGGARPRGPPGLPGPRPGGGAGSARSADPPPHPDIGRLLPVYVHDRYDGFEAKPFLDCTDAEIEHYLAQRRRGRAPSPSACSRRRAGQPRRDGPGRPRPGARRRVPYAVKVHGSALSTSSRPTRSASRPTRARASSPRAAILVGSRHTAESLWAAHRGPGAGAAHAARAARRRRREFAPRERAEAAARLRGAGRAPAGDGRTGRGRGSFARDEAAAGRALASLDPGATGS